MSGRYKLVENLKARKAKDVLNAIVSVLDSDELDDRTLERIVFVVRESTGWSPPPQKVHAPECDMGEDCSCEGGAAPETVSALGVPASEISSNLMPSMPAVIRKIVEQSEARYPVKREKLL